MAATPGQHLRPSHGEGLAAQGPGGERVGDAGRNSAQSSFLQVRAAAAAAVAAAAERRQRPTHPKGLAGRGGGLVGVGGVAASCPLQLAGHLACPLSCGEHVGRAGVVN